MAGSGGITENYDGNILLNIMVEIKIKPAPSVWMLPSHLKTSEIKGGSWLACDGGLSAKNVQADTPPSQASQLPHFDLHMTLEGAGRHLAMSHFVQVIRTWMITILF